MSDKPGSHLRLVTNDDPVEETMHYLDQLPFDLRMAVMVKVFLQMEREMNLTPIMRWIILELVHTIVYEANLRAA